jgi:hypothetical protein
MVVPDTNPGEPVMIALVLTALGLSQSNTSEKSRHENARRFRWRGSDGRWHWAAA